MPSRNKNFIIFPMRWSGHGRTDRTGSAGPALLIIFTIENFADSWLKLL